MGVLLNELCDDIEYVENISQNNIVYVNKLFIEKQWPKVMDVTNAKIVLKEIETAFSKEGIKLFLNIGTLLGFYRNNAFIENDTDIDLSIHKLEIQTLKNIINNLKKKGFHLLKVFKNDTMFSITKNNIKVEISIFIDLKVFFFDMHSFITRGLLLRKKYIKNNKEVVMYGANFSIPINTEKFLEILYGKEWKIPDRDFYENKKFNSRFLLYKKKIIYLLVNYMSQANKIFI